MGRMKAPLPLNQILNKVSDVLMDVCEHDENPKGIFVMSVNGFLTVRVTDLRSEWREPEKMAKLTRACRYLLEHAVPDKKE